MAFLRRVREVRGGSGGGDGGYCRQQPSVESVTVIVIIAVIKAVKGREEADGRKTANYERKDGSELLRRFIEGFPMEALPKLGLGERVGELLIATVGQSVKQSNILQEITSMVNGLRGFFFYRHRFS